MLTFTSVSSVYVLHSAGGIKARVPRDARIILDVVIAQIAKQAVPYVDTEVV